MLFDRGRKDHGLRERARQRNGSEFTKQGGHLGQIYTIFVSSFLGTTQVRPRTPCRRTHTHEHHALLCSHWLVMFMTTHRRFRNCRQYSLAMMTTYASSLAPDYTLGDKKFVDLSTISNDSCHTNRLLHKVRHTTVNYNTQWCNRMTLAPIAPTATSLILPARDNMQA